VLTIYMLVVTVITDKSEIYIKIMFYMHKIKAVNYKNAHFIFYPMH
jgi:hypothetical protein